MGREREPKMTSTIVALLPVIGVSAAMPVWIILVLLFLRGERGVVTATAFVLGATFTRLVQGALLSVVFSDLADDAEREPRVIVSVLLLVLGVLLLVSAARKLMAEDDPDAPPPRWKTMATNAGPLAAFAMGASLLLIAMKHWVFLLGAVGTINDGGLERQQAIGAFLVFVLGAQSLLILPILFAAVAPRRADAVLGRLERWLDANNRTIGIVIATVFGIYFLWKALSGLM